MTTNIYTVKQATELSTLQVQYIAARRALGLANKLRNKTDRKKHRSRVISRMNVLRAQLKVVIKGTLIIL